MKRVRMLLRVSSNQQLETDGDLTIQRQILKDYILKQPDWILDSKEYFEGSKSAYKNTAIQREILQEILKDAEKKEFDILVPYKDDRVGRLMWDTALYVMSLKKYGVDIYTVKDGCISPDTNDIMGQMMLTLRYANAQKSSADTGMRVKDTAIRLVKNGKFIGGRAPYGYKLVYSGEISKHGRALKKLAIDSSKKEIIEEIFYLADKMNYGSAKIANVLNHNNTFKELAPNKIWKSGSITSILTNPIYTGYLAYKRRERINGICHRQSFDNWIMSSKCINEIKIIEFECWLSIQNKRSYRNPNRKKKNLTDETKSKKSNNSFSDKLYCGFCNKKITILSKYNYWTLKNGEKKQSIHKYYLCKHCNTQLQRKNQLSYETFNAFLLKNISLYINTIMKDKEPYDLINEMKINDINQLKKDLENLKYEQQSILENIQILEKKLLLTMQTSSELTYIELLDLLRKQNHDSMEIKNKLDQKQKKLTFSILQLKNNDYQKYKSITWDMLFHICSPDTQNAIINALVDKILIWSDKIEIRTFYDV